MNMPSPETRLYTVYSHTTLDMPYLKSEAGLSLAGTWMEETCQ